MATAVTDASFDTDVLQSTVPVLVDFWAPWCGPCRAMSPIIDELSGEYEGKAKIVKVNIDDNNETSSKFGVMSIPMFIIFKDGQPVKQFVGARSKEQVKQEIESVL